MDPRQLYDLGVKAASESGAWQRSEGKNPEGGLNAKGRASLKAQGHDIKPGVKGKADTPEKMKRKGSFLSRMFGPGAPGSMKKDNGEPSRRALSAKAWGEPVPSDDAGRARLYAKGQALLKRYEGKKKEAAENAYLSVLAHYGLSEKVAALAKLALVAWKRPQNLTPENIGRLSNAVGLNAGKVDLKKIQKGLQAFSTDLDPAQLARHRVLQEKLTPELMRHFDVIPKNMMGGPRTQGMLGMADIHMDPQTGTMLREALSNNPLKRLSGSAILYVGQSYGPKSYQKAFDKAIDPGLTNATLRHELSEKRLIQGASKGYKPTPFASHLGPLPLVAERTGVRDPEVHRIIDKLRTTAKDDIQATKLLRQSGQVGNYTLPEGGRAMRSLERQVERMPIVEGEAARLSLDSPLMAGPGFEKATKQPGFVQNLTERLSPDSRRKMEALRGATDVSRARYQEPMSQDAAHRYLAILSGNRDKSARPGIFGLTHMPEPPAF